MAKRKKSKGRSNRPKSIPMGMTMGAVGFGANVLFTAGKGAAGGSAPAVNWLVDQSQTPTNRMKLATSAIMANLKEPATYLPLIGGALATASPRIPFVNMVANPVNNWIKTVSHGKLRL